jgi:hypothetical protein
VQAATPNRPVAVFVETGLLSTVIVQVTNAPVLI